MEEEEDATISRIIADLEETLTNSSSNSNHNHHHQASPISHSTLTDLQSLLDANDPDIVFRFFDNLSSKKNFSASSIVPPISSAMDSTTTNLSLSASKVYLSLLLSPNSPVFTLFTPEAFLSLLRSSRRSLKKPQQRSSGGSNLLVRCKKKGRARGRKNVERESDGFNNDVSGFDAKMLFLVMKKLESVMGLIHLNRFPNSLKSLIQTVTEIPVLSLSLELGGGLGSYGNLIDLCGRILSKLMRSEHGSVESNAAEVLKSLTPLILMGKCQARTFALGFLSNQTMGMAKESEEIKKAVVNLPKYLVKKAPEKAEPKGLAVEAIMEIVKAMELEDQIGFAVYTVKMSRGKANLRLLAVDLILTIIMLLRDPLGPGLDVEVENSWGFRCLEALIQRCSDSSAVIRA